MGDALTSRQTQILKALIDEYIETAEPVGSEVLEKKYNLGVSSATIRNEMQDLTQMGYLKQPHTSAGRMPTSKAMKFYVGQLMEEKQLSLAEEVKMKEEVWEARDDVDELMEEAVRILADRTRSLSVGVIDDGRTWHAGLANVFTNPEFSDLGLCAGVFSFLEEDENLVEIFLRRLAGSSPVEILFGEDLNSPFLEPVGIVATHFNIKNHQGALGVIGPMRLSYPRVVPLLRHFGNIIEQVTT
jgi:transcriptional regulator of heat shock response